jgi:hypothetical protein
MVAAMNTLPTEKVMKSRLYTILFGMTFGLAAVNVSHAMSQLVSLSMESQWPTTPTPGNVMVYQITAVVRQGSGLLEVGFSCAGLPQGATAQFTPSVLRFTGHEPTSLTATMTVTCTTLMPVDSYPFTITGTALRDSITITNQPQQETNNRIVGPPVLALDRLGDGSFRLHGRGTTGQTYNIEATPSLANPNWTLAGTSTADGNARFTSFPAAVNGSAMGFYRAVETGP